jgi:hypothetical protein
MYHPTLKRSSYLVVTHYTLRFLSETNDVQPCSTNRFNRFLIPPLQGV